MQAIKSKGTSIEILLAKELFAKGFRYRKNDKEVFGKPDLTFRKNKVAIFVDGEFWHGKNWEIKKHEHKSNIEFWHRKIERNIERDRLVNKTLKNQGWKVLRIWGKEIKNNLQVCVTKIEKTLNETKNKN